MYKHFVATGLAAVFGAIMSAGGASATVYTIDESYTVTACTGTVCGTSPPVTDFTSTNKAPTFNSNGGDPTALAGQSSFVALPTSTSVQNFFTLDPNSSGSGTVLGTIQVVFTFK